MQIRRQTDIHYQLEGQTNTKTERHRLTVERTESQRVRQTDRQTDRYTLPVGGADKHKDRET